MAKLTNVVVLPAQVERISYNGKEYVKTEEAAKAGDIIRLGEEDSSYLTSGGFYEVDSVDSADDAQIIDDDGDEYDTASLDEEFTVFAVVGTVPSGRLKVGELAKVVANKADHGAKIGDIVRVLKDDRSTLPFKCEYEDGRELGGHWFAVSDLERFIAEEGFIVHEGEKYRKVKRKAAAGELIIIVDSEDDRYDNGAVFEVARLDCDGDVRVDLGVCDDDAYVTDSEYNVLEPIGSEQSAPTELPSKLPDNYVIHDGAVYVKEARVAKVGELVTVIKAERTHGWEDGVVATCIVVGVDDHNKFESDAPFYDDAVDKGAVSKGKRAQWLRESHYHVLVPTDTATLGGTEYALEKRSPKVGEHVLVVAPRMSQGSYELGTVATVKDVDSHGDPYINGRTTFRSEYVVLVPKTAAELTESPSSGIKAKVGDRIRITSAFGTDGKYANGDEFVVIRVRPDGRVFVAEHDRPIAQSEYDVITAPQYREVKRKANAGDRIKIVARWSDNDPYENGAEFTVNEREGVEVVYVTAKGNDKYRVNDCEYVVLVPAATAIKAGDTVVLTKGGDWPLYGFSDGQRVTVVSTNDTTHSSGAYPIKVRSSGSVGFTTLDNVTLAEVAKPERLSVGDYAVVVDDSDEYEFGKGTIVKILRDDGTSIPYYVESCGRTSWTKALRLVRATNEEVAEAKAQAERKAASAKIKPGDFAKITKYQSGAPAGTIVEITYIQEDGMITYKYEGKGGGWRAGYGHYEILTPKEADTLRRQGEFKPGDRAKIVDVGVALCGFSVGDVVTVADGYDPTDCVFALKVKKANGFYGFCDAEHLRKIGAEEAQQADESAKWAKLGRKVGEFKRGDIVKIAANTSGSRNKIGAIGTVTEGPSRLGSYRVDAGYGDTANWTKVNEMELIAPVESLFTAN